MQKSKLNFKLKSKKKGGFTLIEVIAVIAIICILVVALLPKFSGYITQAKKVAVVDQCRKAVMAAESYDMKLDKPSVKEGESAASSKYLDETSATVSEVKSKAGDYLGDETLDKLDPDMKLTTCKGIVDGTQDFTIDSSGKYVAK